MKVVVTMPALDEEKTIAKVIADIKEVLTKQAVDFRVLVVDDGSVDRTAEVARKAGAIVVSHQRRRGLAAAFATEMRECLKLGAEIIVHTDADGQYRAVDIPKLQKKLTEGYDLVLGSRFMGTIEEMPLIKRFGNRAFTLVISGIAGMRISDGQTGFRAFTNEIAERVVISSRYTYTQEQILRAARQGYRIAEVPVYFGRRGGKSRLMKGPLDYALKAGINILRVYRDYEPLKFFGYVGSTLLLVGFLLGAYITATVVMTGTTGGIPRVILSAILILTGVQIILFGFLADMQRK